MIRNYVLRRAISFSASVLSLITLNALLPGTAGAQTNIPITNFSFENPQIYPFSDDGTIPGWSTPGSTLLGVGVSSIVVHNTPNKSFNQAAPDGNQIGYIGFGFPATDNPYVGVSIAQQTGASVAAGQKYILSAYFGNRLDGYTGNADLQLWEGGTVSGGQVTGGTLLSSLSIDGNAIPRGTFEDFSTTYTASAADSGLLSVRIVDAGGSGRVGNQILFDDVQLDSIAPEGSSLLLLLGGCGGIVGMAALRRRLSRNSA
ncbi:MAG TPA: hypothetical protein VKU00_12955 [Chthonomonadaceae bacterium]|nr:hypothetical protein [Chthonomonadaceae bacterium]